MNSKISEAFEFDDNFNDRFDDFDELPDDDDELDDDENPKPEPKVKKSKERPLGEFRNSFLGCMDLQGDRQTVKNYLNLHQGWFRRCALPMQATPIGNNGYVLTIGKVGALGFYLEPKIGLHLLPAEADSYRIETIPVPGHPPQPYLVDFQAVMDVNPNHEEEATDLTTVEWQLDLTVTLQFPQFIHGFSRSLIEKTGDAILAQVVKNISRRLTANVQRDFHKTIGFKGHKS